MSNIVVFANHTGDRIRVDSSGPSVRPFIEIDIGEPGGQVSVYLSLPQARQLNDCLCQAIADAAPEAITWAVTGEDRHA